MTTALLRRGIATTQVLLTEKSLPDTLEHSVGIERFERMAHAAGIDDLWDLKRLQHGEGTRENPDIVTSMYNKRLIGHHCEEGQPYLTYFYVYKSEPKRCCCGHWFKLVDAEPYEY